jgi:crotonobetainyl-CoA:carnitine CoA-transferase CaiB-like acyl-CoA transferase
MGGALAGTRVLDLSDSVAGQYCARLLADYGADVHLVEGAAGSPVRRMAPLPPGAGESLIFLHLNTGKRAVLRDDLDSLARDADVAIVGNAADRDRLRAANPACVVAVVTGFGLDGPWREWAGSEIVYQALSGAMLNNGMAGRPPLYGCGHRVSYAAGVAACIGILAALHARSLTGAGDDVDISVAETAACMTTAASAYNYSGLNDPMRGTGGSQVCCRGEWVTLWIYGHQWRDFCAALECEYLLDDPRFSGINERQANWVEFIAIMQTHLGDWPADEVVSRLQARRLITAKASSLVALHSDPHLQARGYWETVSTPAGPRTVLGPPFRMSRTPHLVARPAPPPAEKPGVGWSATTPQSASPPATLQPGGPLAGIRVLDMTTAWAGPMAGRILAYLGADVIHVEHATRVDLWRHHRQAFRSRLYPGGEGGARPYNRNVLFNSQNINKRSICLDIKAPRGLELARRLATRCDVVLANFTPGALDRSGLGYEQLRQLRPDIIVTEMPAYGSSGPKREAPAVGATMEMAAGMASLIGYAGGPPTTTGPNFLDPVGALNAAAATLIALAHRERTGEGQYVEVPQVEAAMHLIGEKLIHAALTGEDEPRNGNRSPSAAPHDVFPAEGSDEWVAIAVNDGAQWLALCGVAQLTDLAADPALTGLAGRIAAQEAIGERVAAWTRGRSKLEAASALQDAGVPAAPVMTARDVSTGAFYEARGMFTTLHHPEAGTHAYHGVPIHLARNPGGDRRAAPCLGQDTEEILAGLLNLTEEEIAELDRAGVTSNRPT